MCRFRYSISMCIPAHMSKANICLFPRVSAKPGHSCEPTWWWQKGKLWPAFKRVQMESAVWMRAGRGNFNRKMEGLSVFLRSDIKGEIECWSLQRFPNYCLKRERQNRWWSIYICAQAWGFLLTVTFIDSIRKSQLMSTPHPYSHPPTPVSG